MKDLSNKSVPFSNGITILLCRFECSETHVGHRVRFDRETGNDTEGARVAAPDDPEDTGVLAFVAVMSSPASVTMSAWMMLSAPIPYSAVMRPWPPDVTAPTTPTSCVPRG